MAIYDNRICRMCGRTFSGGPRAWYCPECRIERNKATGRDHKKHGTSRPLGSKDICLNCGKKYIVNGGLQKYCPDCREEMRKKVDNEQGTAYYYKRYDSKAKKEERSEKRREKYTQNRDEINRKRREKYAARKTENDTRND